MPTRIIPAPPADVRECLIYKQMMDASASSDGICAKAESFIKSVQPLMDQISAGPFRFFTLHNRDHGKKVLHLMGELLPNEVLKGLTGLECLILVYIAHLHDLGMLVEAEEKTRVIGAEDFIASIEEWKELASQLSDARKLIKALDEVTNDEVVSMPPGLTREQVESDIVTLTDIALCDYLRPHHADKGRYKKIMPLIESGSDQKLFDFQGVSFDDVLIDICWSHNQDAGVLAEVVDAYEERFPRDRIIAGTSVNTQFLAALLRLADILDFDRERTPRSLLECLGLKGSTLPGSDKSLKEWNKHLSVHTLRCVDDELIVEAECEHPVIESAIRQFCQMIERELRQTVAVLKRNPTETVSRYSLDFPQTVRARINSRGYVFKDLSFRLHQSSVMSLLMGEALYQTPYSAVRELVQNAVDASVLAQKTEARIVQPVRLYLEEANGAKWLCVADDGVGMDDHVLTEYFFNVGKSYYQSAEFRRLLKSKNVDSLVPVGRFGIGVLSAFMIGTVMIVETCRPSSPVGDTRFRTLTIDSKGGLAVVTEMETGRRGTLIRLRLKKEHASDYAFAKLIDYVKRTIVRPAIPVEGNINDSSFELSNKPSLCVSNAGTEYLRNLGLEAITLNAEEIEPACKGKIVLFFVTRDDGKLGHKKSDGSWLRISADFRPEKALAGFSGNRITVNGFVMSLKKASRVLGTKNSIPMVVDLDVPSNDSLTFSASRDKIVAGGRLWVRSLISNIINVSLTKEAIFERLAPETKAELERAFLRFEAAKANTENTGFKTTKELDSTTEKRCQAFSTVISS